MKILDNGKEYEEISYEEYIDKLDEDKDMIYIHFYGSQRYFREVKPAPEFPIKIEMSFDSLLKIDNEKIISFITADGDERILVGVGSKIHKEQDINGILKALLYLLPEDDIIKRLKELR